jgi:hypothetical protein
MDNHLEHRYQIVRTLGDGLRVEITSLDDLDEAKELVAKLPELWPGAYSIEQRNSPVEG